MNSDEFSYSDNDDSSAGDGSARDDSDDDRTDGNRTDGDSVHSDNASSDSTVGFSDTDVPSSLSKSIPRVLGDFELGPELGHGGMGVVYLATEKGLGRKVALKVLPSMHRAADTQVKRFLVEARAAAQLNHDHIVPVYHIGEHEGTHFFTMRYIEGEDLDDVIRKVRGFVKESTAARSSVTKEAENAAGSGTKPDVQRSVDTRIDLSGSSFASSMQSHGTRSAHRLAVSVALIGQAVAEALHHAHERGIVHRDMKPSNLMLDHNNKVWVTDFGLAQLQDSPQLTRTGDMVGTLRYMSPEQASGRRAFIDHRTDVYSLGATLYELATLARAHPGDSQQEVLRAITFERPAPVRRINPRLPKDFETIISKAMERNPSERYQTAAELAADLQRFVNNETLLARRPGRLKRMRDWLYASPVLTATIAAMLIAITLASSAIAWAINNSLDSEREKGQLQAEVLSESQARHALTLSLLNNTTNPGRALILSLFGASRITGYDADQTMMAAVDGNHELHTIDLPQSPRGRLVLNRAGTRGILVPFEVDWDSPKSTTNILDIDKAQIAGFIQTEMPLTDAVFISDDNLVLFTSNSLQDHALFSEMRFGKPGLWDTRDHKVVRAFAEAQPVRISSRSYSPVKQQLVLPNREYSAVVYAAGNWNPVMTLPTLHTQPVIKAVFSPDGSKIATISMDKTVKLWNSVTGELLHSWDYRAREAIGADLEFSASSQRLIVWGDQGTDIYNTADFTLLAHRAEMQAVPGLDDDSILLLDTGANKVTLVDAQSLSAVSTVRAANLIRDFVLLSESQKIAVATEQEIELYDSQTGALTAHLRGHDDLIQSIGVRPLQNEIVSLGSDKTLRFWDVQSNLQRRTFPSDIFELTEAIVAFSPNGSLAAMGSTSGNECILWNPAKPNSLSARLPGRYGISLSKNRIICLEPGNATLFDAQSLRKVKSIRIPDKQDVLSALAFESLDIVLLLTVEGDLWSWNYKTNLLTRCNEAGEHVSSMARDVDGQSALFNYTSGELFTLNLKNSARESLYQFARTIFSLEVHPDGKQVFVAANDDCIIVWNRETTKIEREIKQAGVRINHAKYVADDRIVTHAGPNTNKICLWKVTDGSLIAEHEVRRVRSLKLDDAGENLAIAAHNGAFLWNLNENKFQQIATDSCNDVRVQGNKVIISTPSNVNLGASPEEPPVEKSKIMVWNRDSQQLELTQTLEASARTLAFLDAEHVLITTGYYGVDVAEINQPSKVTHVTGHSHPLLLAAFIDDDQLLSVSQDGKILVSSLSDESSTILGTHQYRLVGAVVSDDCRVLLTADAHGVVRQWDVPTKSVVRELHSGSVCTHLQIGQSGVSGIGVFDSNAIEIWDLRAGTTKKFEYQFKIRQACLSENRNQLIVVTGQASVAKASADRLQASEQAPAQTLEQPSITVEDLTSGKREVLHLAEPAREVRYADQGKKFAVLSSSGTLTVFDSKSLKVDHRLDPKPRLLRLLDNDDRASPTIYAVGLGQIAGWNSTNGQKSLEIPMTLPYFDAMRQVPTKIGTRSNSDWYLIFSQGHFFKRPVKPLEYVTKLAPRSLSTAEQKELLLLGDSGKEAR